jgi:hypothetical protein
MVPEGLKPRECKRVKLCELPPVPYVPTKDEVQDEVARMQSLEIKTTIEKDTTLNFAVWQENGIRKAFLMHVTVVLNAIKKRSHVKDYEMAAKEYEGAKKAVESTKAGLALLDGTGEKGKKSQNKKIKEGEKEDAPEADDNPMKAGFLEDLEKTKQAQRTAKGAMTIAASKMLFYSNLLSPESKHAWNKIVSEQTESDPYVNLQGDTLEGPRGMSRALFNHCVMFHLLTAFPINAAEQEK